MNVREKGRVCVNVYVVITWDHRVSLCVCECEHEGQGVYDVYVIIIHV